MSIFSNRCPHCKTGLIYVQFLRMNKVCDHCGYKFERESGFFTGAMFIDSVILPTSTIPTLIIFGYHGNILAGGILAIIQIIVLSPFVFRYTRLLWIHANYKIDS